MTENEAAPPPVPEAPGTTGDPQVDDALRKLDDLAGRPLTEHPVVFEQIHGALTGALGTLDPASPLAQARADPALATQARAADRAGSFLMSTRRRLDAELVRRGLARSREHAAELVSAGRVAVAGQAAGKTATQVGQDEPITVRQASDDPGYASRGGGKLAGALAAFPALRVAGRRCLDAGASTGGFTDVLLRAGAAEVVAVDVGYGQLAWALRSDDRVTVLDRVNVRHLRPEQVAPPPGWSPPTCRSSR